MRAALQCSVAPLPVHADAAFATFDPNHMHLDPLWNDMHCGADRKNPIRHMLGKAMQAVQNVLKICREESDRTLDLISWLRGLGDYPLVYTACKMLARDEPEHAAAMRTLPSPEVLASITDTAAATDFLTNLSAPFAALRSTRGPRLNELWGTTDLFELQRVG